MATRCGGVRSIIGTHVPPWPYAHEFFTEVQPSARRCPIGVILRGRGDASGVGLMVPHFGSGSCGHMVCLDFRCPRFWFAFSMLTSVASRGMRVARLVVGATCLVINGRVLPIQVTSNKVYIYTRDWHGWKALPGHILDWAVGLR